MTEWARRLCFVATMTGCLAAPLLAEGAAAKPKPPIERKARTANLLRPGDVLEITVYEHSELALRTRVETDGTIRFPLCGEIGAEGRSAADVGEALAAALQKAEIERAQVFVFVAEYAPRSVYVLGEVKGTDSKAVAMPPEGELTALQAVSAVGGFSDDADLDSVFILRGDGEKTWRRIPVKAGEVMAPEGEAEDVTLLPGDRVIVPPADKVFVLGQVKSAGAFRIRPDVKMTVTRAIAMAGGFDRLAAEDKVLLIRDDKVTEIDLRKALRENGDIALDLKLKPRDIVFVMESRW